MNYSVDTLYPVFKVFKMLTITFLFRIELSKQMTNFLIHVCDIGGHVYELLVSILLLNSHLLIKYFHCC
jgi:hypothetical protein